MDSLSRVPGPSGPYAFLRSRRGQRRLCLRHAPRTPRPTEGANRDGHASAPHCAVEIPASPVAGLRDLQQVENVVVELAEFLLDASRRSWATALGASTTGPRLRPSQCGRYEARTSDPPASLNGPQPSRTRTAGAVVTGSYSRRFVRVAPGLAIPTLNPIWSPRSEPSPRPTNDLNRRPLDHASSGPIANPPTRSSPAASSAAHDLPTRTATTV
jgi:hypothetical protein